MDVQWVFSQGGVAICTHPFLYVGYVISMPCVLSQGGVSISSHPSWQDTPYANIYTQRVFLQEVVSIHNLREPTPHTPSILAVYP
jgi:hypothetical protein